MEYVRFSVIGNGMTSDHAIADIKLAISTPRLPMEKFTYKKYRAIDIIQLWTDILDSDLVLSAYSTLNNLV